MQTGPDPEGAFAGGEGGADPQWRPNACRGKRRDPGAVPRWGSSGYALEF